MIVGLNFIMIAQISRIIWKLFPWYALKCKFFPLIVHMSQETQCGVPYSFLGTPSLFHLFSFKTSFQMSINKCGRNDEIRKICEHDSWNYFRQEPSIDAKTSR